MSSATIEHPPWPQVAHEFAQDGGLLDLYVLATDLRAWERVVVEVTARYPTVDFRIDGQDRILPATAAAVFEARARDVGAYWSFDLGGLFVSCHFFGEDEVEFSVDPRDIRTESSFLLVSQLVWDLAQWTGAPAILTPENHPTSPILRAIPNLARVDYVPPSDGFGAAGMTGS